MFAVVRLFVMFLSLLCPLVAHGIFVFVKHEMFSLVLHLLSMVCLGNETESIKLRIKQFCDFPFLFPGYLLSEPISSFGAKSIACSSAKSEFELKTFNIYSI